MLAEYNLQLSQIVRIVGDNVTFNAAVAKHFGLPLGKCLPHSLNLVVKAALKPFKGVHAGCVALSGIIPVGGSARHCKSLKARGLSARLMAVYPNRFASVLPVVAYHRANFETIREWVEAELARGRLKR